MAKLRQLLKLSINGGLYKKMYGRGSEQDRIVMRPVTPGLPGTAGSQGSPAQRGQG